MADTNADDFPDTLAERGRTSYYALERPLQIISGVTVSVLAGFLSQVWGSAALDFRTSITECLYYSGLVFTFSIMITVFRIMMEIQLKYDKIISETFRVIIIFHIGLTGIFYTGMLYRTAHVIAHYARIPNDTPPKKPPYEQIRGLEPYSAIRL